MNRKVLVIAVALMAVAMLATPLVSAKPWTYPKNNPEFELFGVTFGFNWGPSLIAANYAASAALAGAEKVNKVVVVFNEIPTNYQIRIGEAGPGQRVYNLHTDFEYSGVGTVTTWDPVIPYVFDPAHAAATLFWPGSMQHFRVDYVYDFSAVPGGLDGTITMVALVTANGGILVDKASPMDIKSVEGTGDFAGVQIQATVVPLNHVGIVIGWPE